MEVDISIFLSEIVPRISLTESYSRIGVVRHHSSFKCLDLSRINVHQIDTQVSGDHVVMKIETEILKCAIDEALVLRSERTILKMFHVVDNFSKLQKAKIKSDFEV